MVFITKNKEYGKFIEKYSDIRDKNNTIIKNIPLSENSKKSIRINKNKAHLTLEGRKKKKNLYE